MEEIQKEEKQTWNWVPPAPASFADSMVLDGRTLDYQATVEFLPTYDNNDNINAWWYCTSYVLPNSDLCRRPVTFAFNGGPGSASLYIHIGALGPKTVSAGDDTGLTMPVPPYQMSDNPGTLLDLTDLVFIDPVGTGYSRAESWDKAKAFWGVQQDIDSVAEFIRVWLTRHNRWQSPLFIIGESYGGVRGGGLLAKLQDLGMMPLGFVAVSPALTYQGLNTDFMNDHQYIHTLPPMAAAAWFHQKLDKDLEKMSVEEVTRQASEWACTEYLAFLWRGENCLNHEEYEHCVAQLHRFTGIDPSDIRSMRLRIPYRRFAALLLKDERRWASIYDARMTTPGTLQDNAEDPHLFQLACAYESAFHAYFGSHMPMENRRYFVASNQASQNWDHTTGYDAIPGEKKPRGGGYVSTAESMARAMRREPFLKIFVAAGYFDIHCTAEAGKYALSHMDISPALFKNITHRMYFGGHMFYSNPQERLRFKQDIKHFYNDALSNNC